MNRPIFCTICWTKFDLISLERTLLSQEAGKTVYLDRFIVNKCPVCRPEKVEEEKKQS